MSFNRVIKMEFKGAYSGLLLNRFVRTVRGKSGFTLIELLISLAIVGMLATMAINGFSAFKEKANVAVCAEEVRGLEKEIVAHATDRGTFPANLTEIGRQDLLDPWGRGYEYSLTLHRNSGVLMNTDFDLYSKGFNGSTADSIAAAESLDDIIRFDDGAFCNMAARYGL